MRPSETTPRAYPSRQQPPPTHLKGHLPRGTLSGPKPARKSARSPPNGSCPTREGIRSPPYMQLQKRTTRSTMNPCHCLCQRQCRAGSALPAAPPWHPACLPRGWKPNAWLEAERVAGSRRLCKDQVWEPCARLGQQCVRLVRLTQRGAGDPKSNLPRNRDQFAGHIKERVRNANTGLRQDVLHLPCSDAVISPERLRRTPSPDLEVGAPSGCSPPRLKGLDFQVGVEAAGGRGFCAGLRALRDSLQCQTGEPLYY